MNIQQIDVFSLHAQADPHPTYALLREQAPVYRTEPQGYWAVSRYDDVAFVLKHGELFSSDTGFDRLRPPHVDKELWGELEILRGKNLIGSDPPTHTRLRKLVSGAFTPRAIAALEARILQITTEYLDQILAKDELDIVADLAIPLPVTVIAEMLGIDPGRRGDFKRWSDDVLELAQILRHQNVGSERLAALVQSRRELVDHFQELIAERRARPGEDLVSELARREVEEERLTAEEVVSMAVLLLIAGNETTTNLIATGTHLLLDHPEALAALREEPALIPNFIEETLRFEGPGPSLIRRTTAAITLSGVTIPEDQIVMPMLSAANRDPAQFPDPDRFDIRREIRGHVAFGAGIHFCVGAPLSRIEGRIAFEEMWRRLPPFSRTTAQPDWNPTTSLRALRSLPLRFDRAATGV
jgi:cytochrome P450